jgi:tRNA threonylcarbamoyladenosine biosynthesis protein TsaE
MTTKTFNIFLKDETQMTHFGAQLSQHVSSKLLIYLQGDLGMGKTTLVRGFLQGLGHKGRVKSPTYTLVEPYEMSGKSVYHFDLYRMAHPEELEMIGISEYLSENAICIIEWPEKGVGALPEPDLLIELAVQGQGRSLEMSAITSAGQKILEQFLHD